jgi:GT2 family glycosyltransferase
MLPLVSVTIVTFNSRRYIGRCLEAALAQDYPELEIVVIDNSSQDGTPAVLAEYADRIRVIYNDENTGFAAAQNQAIGESTGDWVLTLNPDVLLQPGFLSNLIAAAQTDSRTGTVCGKLLRIGPNFIFQHDRRLDSTGLYFTPNLRHFDRGWNEADDGRYNSTEYVFGASAAAALYRREMIDDISIDGEFFDPDFFAYREDADVAWRAQLLGWRCLYTPEAYAYHVRSVTAATRRGVSTLINMHSVKNRFLMRIKNITADLYRHHAWSILGRDLMVVAGCLLTEPGSLPAFWRLAGCWRSAMHKRKQIFERRRVTDEYLTSWFQEEPVAKPAQQLVLH